jgi:hypothetical protein
VSKKEGSPQSRKYTLPEILKKFFSVEGEENILPLVTRNVKEQYDDIRQELKGRSDEEKIRTVSSLLTEPYGGADILFEMPSASDLLAIANGVPTSSGIDTEREFSRLRRKNELKLQSDSRWCAQVS